jgi:benzil reductase ((S)-benzoin forming)
MEAKRLFIITGSTKGIGKALVETLLNDKRNLVIGIARTELAMEEPNYRFVQVDLSNTPLSEEVVQKIFPEGEFEKIVLVNNAGGIGQIGYLGELDVNAYHRLYQLNVLAPVFLMNEFVKRYKEGLYQERIVINISSGAARKAIDGWSGYGSTKAALNLITQIAQEEANLTGSGIRFFALAPGVVDTDMQTTIRESSKASFSSLSKFIDLKEKGELSSAKDTAQKINYLIDNAANFTEVVQDVRNF